MNQLQSLRETLGVAEMKRPDPSKLDRYREALNEKALDYLKNTRGLTDETIKYFKLGYCEEKNAIAIPVFKGDLLVNIKYRLLDNPKQRYSGEKDAETWIFHDYGVIEAKKKGGILIVEGEFDAMACWQVGIKNVVSPASGKDSYGSWLELIDDISKIYIAYDNDKGGQASALKLSERLGQDKCFEVTYDKYKDANEFLLNSDVVALKQRISVARPFYTRQFKNLQDVILNLKNNTQGYLETKYLPGVKMEPGWMTTISGVTNIGKTTYVLNIANDLVDSGIPTLILPFERGVESVGKRFLGVIEKASAIDFEVYREEDWLRLVHKVQNIPLYLSVPDKEKTLDIIEKASRFFDVKAVVIDHIDYMVRQVGGNRGDCMMDTLQSLKHLAEERGLYLFVVAHIRKIENGGIANSTSRKPTLDDLKGSSALSQDPETVVMLSHYDEKKVLVDVLKNKGAMESVVFDVDLDTGVMKEGILQQPYSPEQIKKIWTEEF